MNGYMPTNWKTQKKWTNLQKHSLPKLSQEKTDHLNRSALHSPVGNHKFVFEVCISGVSLIIASLSFLLFIWVFSLCLIARKEIEPVLDKQKTPCKQKSRTRWLHWGILPNTQRIYLSFSNYSKRWKRRQHSQSHSMKPPAPYTKTR